MPFSLSPNPPQKFTHTKTNARIPWQLIYLGIYKFFQKNGPEMDDLSCTDCGVAVTIGAVGALTELFALPGAATLSSLATDPPDAADLRIC